MKKMILLLSLISSVSWGASSQHFNVPVKISDSTTSTTSTSGALVVTGGAGVGGSLNVAGAVAASNTSGAQVTASGWSTAGGAATQNGEILLGASAGDLGRIQYDAGASTTFYFDNSYNNAAAAMKFRLRTAGTPVTALTLTGAGDATVAGTLTATALSGPLTGNASTATALAADPADCAADRYATTIAASGALTCAQVTNAGLAGSIAASKLVGTDITSLANLVTTGTLTGGATGAGFTVALGTSTVTGTLGATNGGTAQSTWTLGDTLYSSASNTLSKLAGNITTTKKYLGQTGNGSISAAPAWAQPDFSEFSGTVTNAQLAGSIADSKLSTISTAGKVSGDAITSGTISGTTIFNAGAVTSSGALSVSSTAVIGTGGTTSALSIGATTKAIDGSSVLNFVNSSSSVNWRIISNNTIAGDLNIIPSTSGGGVTFSNPALIFDPLGNVIIGTAALATNATAGFLYIDSGAGTPTGTPTTRTGRVPMYYDTTNHKICFYDPTTPSWRCSAAM